MSTKMKGRMDPAVSPVVGVLLMLVVTIIIAAVVSSFASGLTEGTSEAPTATLDVHVYAPRMDPTSGVITPAMTIQHMSGDILPTKDLKITSLMKNLTTNAMSQGTLTSEIALPGEAGWSSWNSDNYSAPLYINDMTRFGTAVTSNEYNSCWFGNESAVLRPGDVLTTPSGWVGIGWSGNSYSNPGLDYLTNMSCSDAATGFAELKTIQITIVDKPSGKAIYDKEVTIE